ncbi:MAG: outer membrane protein transport protein [Flavobacteriales bacterium]|nr:outer membrane protein transport protein [Bacteroidota bacterium]MCB9240805.1 outer membrane protein transport protein [Flavobacteriales bacterium]
MKRLIFSIATASVCLFSYAQNDIDALRYSQSDIGSTARSMASGGAFGSLGADISSAGINPAGIALYRSNSFIMGLGMQNAKVTGDYLGNSIRDNEFNLNVPNLGFVINNKKYDGRKPATSGWLNTNFSMTMNRTANYHQIINYGGDNTESSMLDYFAQRADGLSVSELGASDEELNYGYYDLETMMWEAYLIDSVANRQYAAALNPLERNTSQRNVISSRGSKNEIGLTLASNYENKFYIGGGVQLTTVRYRETNRFTEIDNGLTLNNWTSWELQQHLTTTGVGVSGNLGIIVRPKSRIRLGAALKTPTIYSLNDEYYDELYTTYDDGGDLDLRSADGTYSYKVVSPLQTTLSASYLFGKKGFISADAEFVDYSSMRLRPVNGAFEVANDVIRSKYKDVVNLRVGGEFVHDMFRFRAGAAHYGSPLYTATSNNLQRLYLTGGIGIQEKDWSLDLALVQRREATIRQPYTVDGVGVDYAENKLVRNSMVLTLSTRF